MVMLCAVCRCSERHGDILGYQEPQQLKCTAFREVQYLDTLWCKGSKGLRRQRDGLIELASCHYL